MRPTIAADDDVRLRPAAAGECDRLGALALAAKGHWGYGRAFLDACRAELAVVAADLPEIVVAERDGDVLGWHRVTGGPPVGELDGLWVRPDVIGTGLGRLLWTDAVRVASARGLRTVRIGSDPHAEGFYRAMGAERIGTVASGSVPGREIPLLRFRVPAAG